MKQRPAHQLGRRQPPAKVEPAKSETKVVKVEVKKQEEEKKPAPSTPAQTHPPFKGGHYELSARMTKMVETELRDIMIKVWQELPDNPVDKAECSVVDKLRNQFSDDLRNVLGLNVTKRLLNVYNPLNVKVQFSGKPEKADLGDFLKKYNFNAFKRIEKTVNMFAAQVKTINDFDRICTEKEIRCGKIKVTVSPLYRFTKCPENLITQYNDSAPNDNNKSTTDAIDDKMKPKADSEQKKTNDGSKETVKHKADEVETTTAAQASKTDHNKIATDNATNSAKNVVANKLSENKPVAKTPQNEVKTAATKTVAENKTPTKAATVQNIGNKTSNDKPIAENKSAANKTNAENKPVTNKTVAENKSVVNKTVAENKPPVNKTSAENKPPVKPITAAAVLNKSITENKTTVKKTVAENKPVTEKKTISPNKPAPKPAVQNTLVKKAPETAKKVVPAPAKKGVTNKKVEHDFDELDDYDILALMSEGIVLDECSGSDLE